MHAAPDSVGAKRAHEGPGYLPYGRVFLFQAPVARDVPGARSCPRRKLTCAASAMQHERNVVPDHR
jgi:hypothetical protein